ncbi:MAG: hypothetical protein ACW98X_25065 [Promethearchaeota archaeon]
MIFSYQCPGDDKKPGKKERRYIMILQNNYEYHQDKFNFISINYETGIFDSHIENPTKKKFFYKYVSRQCKNALILIGGT